MNEFVFQWPAVLALLLASIPLVWLLAHARKQRRLLIEAMGGGHPTHRKLRDILRVSAFILLVLALARPSYAPRTESISRSGRDVVFAIDVSQSMLAEDAPSSRLEVAKQGVRDALNTFSNERVGLVVYAGSASILCPLTYDYDFVRYMLDQTSTRTVDFGGTTVQAAVEKVVDQVFIDGRKDVQDLIVMTDGGDHDSVVTKTIELLNEKGIDTLLIGLGSPHQGAPIKIKDAEGNTKLLQYQGSTVYTKLEDAALRDFAAQSNRVDYLPLGTQPFNLGQIYIEYAQDKPVDSTDSDNGIIIYQEVALFFLIPALLLLLLSERWGARGLKMGPAAAVLAMLMILPKLDAATDFQNQYESAISTFKTGAYEEAVALFAELQQNASDSTASTEQIAAIQFNRGLALIAQSTAQETPQAALSFAREAQLAFLAAKRSDPSLNRAGVRLQMTAKTISNLNAQIAEMEEQNELVNEKMKTLIALLQALLKAQTELREQVIEQESASNATQQIKAFLSSQNQLRSDSKAIQLLMEELDQMMKVEGIETEETLMTEPIRHIMRAQVSQETAAMHLKQVDKWPLSRELQLDAEHLVEQILKLLESNSQQDPSDNEDWEGYDEDYDYMAESDQSMSSSEAMDGDFAANSEMQELPIPNYSAEDILMEEQGNQQFRQQKRASVNAAKVEKDF
ncbi:MAG TPA: VWA domain-containing protein [Opitutae bacterium]|nr:VWA domain-containing protein [Opitutae bacterium]